MIKISHALLILLVAASCSTSSVTTTNLRDLASFEPDAIVYALPQTRLVFTVTAEKSVFVPGPYNKYASEFLGITGAQANPLTKWSIIDIKLSTLNEPDPEHFYSAKIVNSPSAVQAINDLTNNGVLMQACNENNFQLTHNNNISNVDEIPFIDLTVKPFYFEDTKKKQKNVLQDSAFALIPSHEKHLVAKSEKEKAFEAAQFILKIRKRRFKLVSGQYEVFPEGIALKAAVDELNRLEKEYLSLFIGKTFNDTISNIYSAVPSGNEELQRFTLFRFSTETGFVTSAENEGIPIIMEVKDLKQNELLNQLHVPSQGNGKSNVIFHRLPDKSSVSVLYNSHILLESELPVFQSGAILPYFIPLKKR